MKPSPITIPQRPKGLRFKIEGLVDPKFAIDANAATIDIFDVIGLDVTDTKIAGALRMIGNKAVTVRINSPGGDPFTGMSIYNQLRAHPQTVRVEVLGIAASAASIIAMAGDTIEMARASQIMIHRASGLVVGDADDMRAFGAALDQTNSVMAGLYATRTGLPLEQIVSMMAAQTFMTSDEAIELGFADALLERDALPAPRKSEAAINSRRELEELFASAGVPRPRRRRMAAAAWSAAEAGDDNELDLNRIGAALTDQFAELKKFLS